MRVTVHLRKFYSWQQVPKDVVVTDDDVRSGRVKPGKTGGYEMRVVKSPPAGLATSPTEIMISERTLIEKIIEEKSDVRKAGRTITRNQAAAHLIQDQLLPEHGEWDWIAKFEVHDDGPHEELFREVLEPHTKTPHGRRAGRMNVPPDHVSDHVAKYLGDWSPLPKAPFALEAKTPEEVAAAFDKASPEEVAAHVTAHRAAWQDNQRTVLAHLNAHFGVK